MEPTHAPDPVVLVQLLTRWYYSTVWNPHMLRIEKLGLFCKSLELLADTLVSFNDRGLIPFLSFADATVPFFCGCDCVLDLTNVHA